MISEIIISATWTVAGRSPTVGSGGLVLQMSVEVFWLYISTLIILTNRINRLSASKRKHLCTGISRGERRFEVSSDIYIYKLIMLEVVSE